MNQKSKNLICLIFVIITIVGVGLYFTTITKPEETNLTFYAMVKEVYGDSAILVPFPDSDLSSELSANITGVQSGEIIKVVCLPEIKETYPAQVDVISYEKMIKQTTTPNYNIDSIPEEPSL